MNALRIPFNYSHFLYDKKQLFPFKINQEGFQQLDRVVKICATHGIYTILDLHAAPGGQNTDWHSDSPGHHAAFWDLMDYQNWVVELWKEIALRYKDQPWVAGYNPLNEPTEETETKLLEFYDRVVKTIRDVDLDHLSISDHYEVANTQSSSMQTHLVLIFRSSVRTKHVAGSRGLVSYTRCMTIANMDFPVFVISQHWLIGLTLKDHLKRNALSCEKIIYLFGMESSGLSTTQKVQKRTP
jgi:hypothetical protein